MLYLLKVPADVSLHSHGDNTVFPGRRINSILNQQLSTAVPTQQSTYLTGWSKLVYHMINNTAGMLGLRGGRGKLTPLDFHPTPQKTTSGIESHLSVFS